MKTKEEILKILRKELPYLKEKFHVKSLGLFGSYVKERQKMKSDIDVLVEFEESIGLLEFIRLENYLSDLLGAQVDLVMKSALKPRIGRHILKEVAYCEKRNR
jgi:hypothetical protein